ncbi:hypothetical protein [Paracoccus jiaweipingae]|uniref:hypothetical protein n=1 Tax=unclassified Paracoccus (in: a-proteobacteria) TaxID=2688777 RepID=UPI0037A1FABD
MTDITASRPVPAQPPRKGERPALRPVVKPAQDAARAARDAMIAEAERIMGVSPILGVTGPPPGY